MYFWEHRGTSREIRIGRTYKRLTLSHGPKGRRSHRLSPSLPPPSFAAFSTTYRLRQPMCWAPFEDASGTCAAFPASRILDDFSTGHGTSKTQPWATPVSTSSFTREAPIAQACDIPPPFYRIIARFPKLWLQYGCQRRGRRLKQNLLANQVWKFYQECGRWDTAGSSSTHPWNNTALGRSRSGLPANQRAGPAVGEAAGRHERPANDSVVLLCQQPLRTPIPSPPRIPIF